MLLYLLRHAEAEPHSSDDNSRRLTEKGRDQSERVGKFLTSQGLKPDLILTSPVTRARETAGIVAKKLGDAEVIQVPWLACGMDPGTALGELAGYSRFESVMIVGHEPDFSSLVTDLLGAGSSATINISKASLTAMDLSRFVSGGGVLKFLLPVKLM